MHTWLWRSLFCDVEILRFNVSYAKLKKESNILTISKNHHCKLDQIQIQHCIIFFSILKIKRHVCYFFSHYRLSGIFVFLGGETARFTWPIQYRPIYDMIFGNLADLVGDVNQTFKESKCSLDLTSKSLHQFLWPCKFPCLCAWG